MTDVRKRLAKLNKIVHRSLAAEEARLLDKAYERRIRAAIEYGLLLARPDLTPDEALKDPVAFHTAAICLIEALWRWHPDPTPERLEGYFKAMQASVERRMAQQKAEQDAP